MSADFRTAILIAAYNAEKTLERAVASALAQPEAAEICIIDDASTDGTFALANALAARSPRVLALRQPANAGPSAARNAGIAATTSPWLAVLDADDYLLEGRLQRLHALAVDADFVADTLIRTTGPEPAFAPQKLTPTPLSFERFVLGNLGRSTGPLDLGFMKPLMRRGFLQSNRLSYRTDMRLGEDYELYARALALGCRFHTCGPAGYVSVERPGSLSKEHGIADLQLLRDCDDSLAAIPGLTAPQQSALRQHWASVDRRLQWRRLIEAVKQRDAGAALSTFHSLDAALFLAGKLVEQAWLRGTGRGPRRAVLSTS